MNKLVEQFFHEMVKDKTGKRYQFTRVPQNANSKKWSELLDNYAIDETFGRNTFINDGDIIKTEEDDNWYEVIETSQDEEGMTLYVVPVDEFGNKLPKSKMTKLSTDLMGSADYFNNQISNKGYATTIYLEKGTDFLYVPLEGEWSDAKNDYVYDRRHLKTSDAYYTFYDRDEYGRNIPTDEYLAEHPDFDPDIDSVDNRYSKRTNIKRQGNSEARAALRARKAAYDADTEAMEGRAAARNRHEQLYSAFSGFSSDFEKLQPNVSPSDMEKLKAETREQGHVPYGHPKMSIKEFKKWVNDIGGDWDVVRSAMDQISGDLSTAIYNNRYGN